MIQDQYIDQSNEPYPGCSANEGGGAQCWQRSDRTCRQGCEAVSCEARRYKRFRRPAPSSLLHQDRADNCAEAKATQKKPESDWAVLHVVGNKRQQGGERR